MSAIGIPADLPRATLLAKNLLPWTPDIDARRQDQPSIISGRNFRDRVDGPCSYWAHEFINDNLFDAANRIKITELTTIYGSLYGTPVGLYKIDPVTKLAQLLLGPPTVTLTNTYWPWSRAYVGGVYYFAQYDIGLWQYDPVNDKLTKIATPAGDKIRYVAADHGRLIYFSDTVVANSALDDGTNLTPDLASGAGAQSLGIVGGTPYKIESLERDGFLVYMSEGILKGSFTTQAYVYTYEDKFLNVRTFSPNAQANIPGVGVVSLDGNGFWLTSDTNYTAFGKPQPWEEEKSDYIKNNILEDMDRTLNGTIQMYYSRALQCLFVSFSSNLLQGFFQTTFVWDKVSKRWSSFDQAHYGIFETYDATTNTYTCSFMDTNGYMQAFAETDFTEDYPDSPLSIWDYTFRPAQTDETAQVITIPTINAGKPVEYCSTEILFSDNNPNYYRNFTVSGLYMINEEVYSDTVSLGGDPATDPIVTPIVFQTEVDMYVSGFVELFAVPYLVPEISLDSNIVIGPWRYNDQKAFAEETSNVESILLGCQASNGFTIYEDWNLLNSTEDWNVLNGAEDWSSGSAIPNNYNLILISSSDSFTTPPQGYEYLPTFADFTSTKLYKPIGFDGLYHALVLDASQVGQSFNLKTIDMTLKYTGVYTAG